MRSLFPILALGAVAYFFFSKKSTVSPPGQIQREAAQQYAANQAVFNQIQWQDALQGVDLSTGMRGLGGWV